MISYIAVALMSLSLGNQAYNIPQGLNLGWHVERPNGKLFVLAPEEYWFNDNLDMHVSLYVHRKSVVFSTTSFTKSLLEEVRDLDMVVEDKGDVVGDGLALTIKGEGRVGIVETYSFKDSADIDKIAIIAVWAEAHHAEALKDIPLIVQRFQRLPRSQRYGQQQHRQQPSVLLKRRIFGNN